MLKCRRLLAHIQFAEYQLCECVKDVLMWVWLARWTYERAVNLLLENTAIAEDDICSEVRRYITWPAQV